VRRLVGSSTTVVAPDDVLLLPEHVVPRGGAEAYERAVGDLARALGCHVVGGSHHQARADGVFNAGVACAPDGGVVGRYEKVRPYSGERESVRPGRRASQTRPPPTRTSCSGRSAPHRSRSTSSTSTASRIFGATVGVEGSSGRADSGHELPVLDPVRALGLRAEPPAPVGLVVLVVALEPDRAALALEGEDVGGDAVEEPAVVADDHGAAAEVDERVLHGAQRVDVEVV